MGKTLEGTVALATGGSRGLGAVTAAKLAEAVCFLAGPSAGYITGGAINLTGGLTI